MATPHETARATVWRLPGGAREADRLAVEEPLEIRVNGTAVAVTMHGSLPPSSRLQGISRSAHATATLRPVGTEPVKQIVSAAAITAWPTSPGPIPGA